MHTFPRLARSWLPLAVVLLLAVLLWPSSLEGQPSAEVVDPQKPAKPTTKLPDDWVKRMTWRDIGPATMGGRITALAVYEADPSTYYVATASGGLLRTTNNGVTFEHCFDRETTVSIGDVAVAASNRDLVWVGTGENNPRNSVSYGDGVYKSTDGGKKWQHMGLKQTFQIGKVLIHPTNPDIVYVGALGRLYGPNEERGVFKTTDGGHSWTKVLYTDANTGVIDMRMHPTDPETLLVAMWERRRDGFDSWLGERRPDGIDTYDPAVRWGAAAGIYKTTDGGKSFHKVTKGLPSNKLGRISIDWYRKDPNVVYAIVDCEQIGMGKPPPRPAASNVFLGITGEDEPQGGARLTSVSEGGPAGQAGLQLDDVVQAVDGKDVKSYEALIEQIRSHKAGDKVKLKVLRGDAPKEIEVTLAERPGGGQGRPGGPGGFGGPGGPSSTRPNAAYYGGQRENVQDTQGNDGSEFGGVYRSADAGESWTRINSLNPRPMYFSQVRVDPSDERFLYVLGIALHRSRDGGKTFRPDGSNGVHADQHALWINPRDGRHQIVGTDGGFYVTYDRMARWDHLNHLALGQFYHVAVCTKRPYWVYGGLQDNGSWGGPSIGLRGLGPINEDWVSVAGSDGFTCRVDPNDPDLIYYTAQNGAMGRRNLRTGERAGIRPAGQRGQNAERFNWNTPFILSQHNSQIFYCASHRVFRSVSRGDDLRVISPEITLTKRGSGTALAESPRNPDVLWAGTDDGGLWITKDGGKNWTNVTDKVGLPRPLWVATIEASRFAEGRAYVAFDAHRSDDDEPYVYVTEDHGQTWKSLRSNLPTGSTRCLREDVQNPDLLYLGTEFAVWASLDRGGSWTRLNNNLPTVAVHEIAVHPTVGEIVAATHGRSLWVLDVTTLRQLKPDVFSEKPTLFKPATAVRWETQPARGRTNRRYVGKNPPPGAPIQYVLAKKAEKVTLEVLDIDGTVVSRQNGSTTPGLHQVTWDLTRPSPQPARPPQPPREGQGSQPAQAQAQGQAQPATQGQGRQARQGQGGGFAQTRRLASPGAYRVVLAVDGQTFSQSIRVEADPNVPASARMIAEEEDIIVIDD